MRKLNIKRWSSEKISQRVFYLLVGVTVVVFGLFFLVGYDMPFEENPDFNAPLFTDVLIGLMCLVLLGAIGLAISSIVHTYRSSDKEDELSHRIPSQLISRATWGFTVLLLLVTFCLGSSNSVLINGQTFQDWMWLKTTDMLVYSTLVMLVVAIGAVAFGATRYVRKDRKS